MSCLFISELRRLSKLSAEAVENTDSFNELNSYLHVMRNTEADFQNLIASISDVGHKQLVLVCGSAGDGKSHLLSYLKFKDPQNILKDFEIINDATESNAPRETAIETLAKKIVAFSDARLHDGTKEKVILAINLGMLNNFIDSSEGSAFGELKQYVQNNNIFSVAQSLPRDKDSVFQHIDFSDYQLYSLIAQGVNSDYLRLLFHKIFVQDDNNPFYQAYIKSTNCPHHVHCPVRHNFEFLMDKSVQAMLIQRVIEVCVKDKLIVTSRDVLNFVFDVIASPDFDDKDFWKTISNPLIFLESYISYTTPMLVFENVGTSDLIDHITIHSAKNNCVEDRDKAVLDFYAAEDVTSIVKEAFGASKYGAMLVNSNLSAIDNFKVDAKKYLYKFILHYSELTHPNQLGSDTVFSSFIADLYNTYAGNKMALKGLYTAVKESIYSWDGVYSDDHICVDDSNEEYSILEQLTINPSLSPLNGESEIIQFSPVLTVQFKNDSGTDSVKLQIDYSLYKLIHAMKSGYRPTSQDRNIHADFVSKIKALTEFGTKKSRIVIISKDVSISSRFVFEENEFGYSFKEVSL